MKRQEEIFIAVIGSGKATPEEAGLAEAVGKEIARRGAVLVCGGLGGVMEAACRGARQNNGVTVGILPGDDRQAANPYVQIPIATGLSHARNVIVVKSAQAVIAIGGSYGTLSEIGHARQSGIPVIALKTWSLARNGKPDNSLMPAKNPVEAVDIACKLIKAQEGD